MFMRSVLAGLSSLLVITLKKTLVFPTFLHCFFYLVNILNWFSAQRTLVVPIFNPFNYAI